MTNTHISNPDSSGSHHTFDELIREMNIPNLNVSFSQRMKKNWKMRITRSENRRYLTIPAYLYNAPQEIKKALIAWAMLPQLGTPSKIIARQDEKRTLERTVQHYIRANHSDHSQLYVDRLSDQNHPELYAVHDLQDVFNSVNKEYFNNELTAILRWGKLTSGVSYQMTRKTPDGQTVQIITIAGSYNHHDVPRFAIEAVMFHEMLHIKIPPYKKNGRNIIHGPEFKRIEKAYKFYVQWRIWEREHLLNIIRNRRHLRGKR
jgi:hypothetical protein